MRTYQREPGKSLDSGRFSGKILDFSRNFAVSGRYWRAKRDAWHFFTPGRSSAHRSQHGRNRCLNSSNQSTLSVQPEIPVPRKKATGDPRASIHGQLRFMARWFRIQRPHTPHSAVQRSRERFTSAAKTFQSSSCQRRRTRRGCAVRHRVQRPRVGTHGAHVHSGTSNFSTAHGYVRSLQDSNAATPGQRRLPCLSSTRTASVARQLVCMARTRVIGIDIYTYRHTYLRGSQVIFPSQPALVRRQTHLGLRIEILVITDPGPDSGYPLNPRQSLGTGARSRVQPQMHENRL